MYDPRYIVGRYLGNHLWVVTLAGEVHSGMHLKLSERFAMADPENLKGGGPEKNFDNLPRKSANFTPFLKKCSQKF